jgi:hypothetical protein
MKQTSGNNKKNWHGMIPYKWISTKKNWSSIMLKEGWGILNREFLANIFIKAFQETVTLELC